MGRWSRFGLEVVVVLRVGGLCSSVVVEGMTMGMVMGMGKVRLWINLKVCTSNAVFVKDTVYIKIKGIKYRFLTKEMELA